MLQALSLVMALTLPPIAPHSWSELNEWLDDWNARRQKAEAEMFFVLEWEWFDMLERHPNWDGRHLDPPPPPGSFPGCTNTVARFQRWPLPRNGSRGRTMAGTSGILLWIGSGSRPMSHGPRVWGEPQRSEPFLRGLWPHAGNALLGRRVRRIEGSAI